MNNRKLIVAGVYLSDVADALKERNVALTEANLKAAAIHVENIASAYAKAVLQDTSREDWLDWIETFSQKQEVICHWCHKYTDRLAADLVGADGGEDMYWCGCEEKHE